MGSDEIFARWASLFVSSLDNCNAENSCAEPAEPAYTGVTPAASELLQSVDSGGVPAFVTSRLIEIACENGIEADADWTPNEIIEAIREKAVPSE